MNNFKQLREELRLSQQDVAVMLGVTRVTYIKWEQDTSTMPLGKYELLNLEFARLKELQED